ncbi:MAG TPA: hypothetical protein VFX61_07820 [Micromonosporaceae bacterium]|nr:hypothetical protein [Micromonosporaceae bacterium]
MSISGKISTFRSKIFFWIGLPVIAVAGLIFGSLDLAPTWQAKFGNGTPGTFTAVHEECSRRNCTWYGNFVAENGDQRRDVILYDDPDGLGSGDTVEALDTGARNGVFATTGGYTWLLVTGITLAGVVAAVAWITTIVRWLGRRRATATAAS